MASSFQFQNLASDSLRTDPTARRQRTHQCAWVSATDGPCHAAALRDRSHCFFHDPESAGAAADARRKGGLRRRREAALATVYDLEDLATARGLWRLLEISVRETLALENSVARSRTLVAAVAMGTRLLGAAELESRVAALESAKSLDPVPRSDDWIEGSLLDQEPVDDRPAR